MVWHQPKAYQPCGIFFWQISGSVEFGLLVVLLKSKRSKIKLATMNELTKPIINPDTQAMLNSLQLVVSRTLERKRRFGHWDGKAPVAVGDDAPQHLLPISFNATSAREVSIHAE